MLNVNDYNSCQSYIETLVSTVDFSKVKYNHTKDIDFTKFDLSELPEVNYEELDARVEKINDLINKVKDSLKSSRMSVEKKENLKKAMSYVIEDINVYKTLPTEDYLENKKYYSLNTIKNRIYDLSTKSPISMREELKGFNKIMESELNSLYKNIGNRDHIINRISEVLLRKSKEFYTEKYKKEIENKDLTIEDIKNLKDDSELNATSSIVNARFGKGASLLLHSIYWTKENDTVQVEFTWNENIKGIIDFAKSLGLKEIAFKGNSTAVLGNLNIITKMGLSFKIVEIENKDFIENTIIPAAIVQL